MKGSPEIFGTVTVGERGQVVIPMKARQTLKIRAGDRMIAMSGPPGGDIVAFIPVQHIAGFLKHFESHISDLKKELSRQSA